jgi:hypothetical protein
MNRWLSSVAAKIKMLGRGHSLPRPRRRVCLGIETLEERQLLSTGFSLTPQGPPGSFRGYSLTVSGHTTPGFVNDNIVVTQAPGSSGSVLQVNLNDQVVTFPANLISSVTANPGSGSDTVTIQGSPPGVGVTINGATGSNDWIRVLWSGGASSGGPVSLNYAAGQATLTVDDSADPTSRVATVTSSAVTFQGLSPVSYSGNVTSLKVYGGTAATVDDSFTVQSTAAATPVTVYTGAGLNSVYVGNNHLLTGLLGALDVECSASSGQINLFVDDSAEIGRKAVVTYNTVQFQGLGTITYGTGVSSLSLMGSPAISPYVYDEVWVSSVSPYTSVTIFDELLSNVNGPAWLSTTVVTSPATVGGGGGRTGGNFAG